MGIETTWMKKGHGPDGVIGDTNNPDTVNTFAYSYHDCITITSGAFCHVNYNIHWYYLCYFCIFALISICSVVDYQVYLFPGLDEMRDHAIMDQMKHK